MPVLFEEHSKSTLKINFSDRPDSKRRSIGRDQWWSEEGLVCKISQQLPVTFGGLVTLLVYTVGCLQAFLEAVWRLSVKPLCFHKANRFGSVLPFPQVLSLYRQGVSSWRDVKHMDSKSTSLVFLDHIYFMSHFSYWSNKNYSYTELRRVSRAWMH